MTSIPHTPYTTDGNPAKISKAGKTTFFTHEREFSVRNIAVNKETGKVQTIAIPVTQSVPMIKGKNPKSPRIGFHLEVHNNSHNDFSSNIGIDLKIRPTPINISNNTEIIVKINITEPATLSFNRRTTEVFCIISHFSEEIIFVEV